MGQAAPIPGPRGLDGLDGLDGLPGKDSTVPGPRGKDSVVPGPRGNDSVVPGPKGEDAKMIGPPGKDSTVPGPRGNDSTVPGPRGTGIVGMVIDENGITVNTDDRSSYTAKADMGTTLKKVTLWCGADGKICKFPIGAPGINFTQDFQNTVQNNPGVSEISNDTTNSKSLIIVANNSGGQRQVNLFDNLKVNKLLSSDGFKSTGPAEFLDNVSVSGSINASSMITDEICNKSGDSCIGFANKGVYFKTPRGKSLQLQYL